LLKEINLGGLKMRLILLLLMVSALAVGLACNAAAKPEIRKAEAPKTAPAAPQPEAHNHAEDSSTPRITLADAKKEFDAGTAVFVDTRDLSSYRFSRIKGAVHMPTDTAANRLKELPKGKKIIAYCS
jgi:hypothetical protein